MTAWKQDIETAIAQSPIPDRETALRTQEKLLFLFATRLRIRAIAHFRAAEDNGTHCSSNRRVAGRPGRRGLCPPNHARVRSVLPLI